MLRTKNTLHPRLRNKFFKKGDLVWVWNKGDVKVYSVCFKRKLGYGIKPIKLDDYIIQPTFLCSLPKNHKSARVVWNQCSSTKPKFKKYK